VWTLIAALDNFEHAVVAEVELDPSGAGSKLGQPRLSALTAPPDRTDGIADLELVKASPVAPPEVRRPGAVT
jgi:hypothetical protein